MRMLVLGAGLQCSACAYDLLAHTDHDVVLADLRVDDLPAFLQPYLGGRLTAVAVDANDHDAMRRVMQGVAATMSAFPYYFNGPLSALAIEAGSHFCDLGANTEIVMEQKAKAPRAQKKTVHPAVITPTNIELRNHRQNGGWFGSVISARKLSRVGFSGMTVWELRLPSLNAADATHTTGNSANASASRATR